jgi:hypothetical protein
MDVVVQNRIKRGSVRKGKAGTAMYDLTLERRVSDRRDGLQPELEGIQYFDRRRRDERRQDTRPLNEFPFLPEAIL